MKKVFTIVLVILGSALYSASTLMAADKYDLAIVWLNATKPIVQVFQNGTQVKVIDTGKKNTDIEGQMEQLLTVVSNLTAEGWEIINVGVGHTYYLKRKH